MPQALSLLGGAPVRTRAFQTWPVTGPDDEARLLRVLRSGKWGRLDGPEVSEFETRFAALHDARFCIAVANGTVSLRLALLAGELPGDAEVIVPPYTFLATASAVLEANMVPVFADVDAETFNLSPAAVEAAITPRTRAMIVVHLGGLPAEMDALLGIARRHDLLVIEDAAQAHGAAYRERPVGTLGRAGSFSFQSTKNLTSGEGGALVTSNEAFADALRSLHNCGRVPGGLWYEHHRLGGNYRLSEFQGAVLNGQLDRFESQLNLRERNGRCLTRELSGIPGVLPQVRTADCTRHAYHLFLFRIDSQAFGAPREAVIAALQAEGIPVSRGYGLPLYRQPLFLNKAFGPYLSPSTTRRLDYAEVNCPNCEILCHEQGAWLEQNLLLGPRSELDDVVRAFEKVYSQRDALRQWSQRTDENRNLSRRHHARAGG